MDYDNDYLKEENNIQEYPKKSEPIKLDSGGKTSGNIVNVASHTNIGKNILNNGGKILNGGSQIVSNINRNPLGNITQNTTTIQSDQTLEDNSNIENKASDFPKEDIESESKEEFNQNKDGNHSPFNLLNNNKMSFNLIGGNKKKYSFASKLKLYFMCGGVCLIIFIIMFILLFLDVGMDKMFGTLEWNDDVVETDNGISSETDFSSDNSVEIKDNDLLTLIGENNIKEIEDSIKNKVSNNTCSGIGVANSLIALIDGLNKHNLKIPYVENGRTSKEVVVDPNWGTKIDENNVKIVNGLDDKGLVFWAMNVTGINTDETFDFNAIEDFTTLSEITSGDILRGTDLKIVLQNTGNTIKVAEASIDGITYKEYSYQTLSDYSYLSMANFYSINCTN